jgi:hypothetical protein
MRYLDPTFSVGPPDKVTCCEACVYGAKYHAPWCKEDQTYPIDTGHKPALYWDHAGR